MANLKISNGTLVNVGTIRILLGARKGPRILDAQLDNQGTLSIEHPSQIYNASKTFSSPNGTIDVASGQTLTVSGGTTVLGRNTVMSGGGVIDLAAAHTLELASDVTLANGESQLRFGGTVTVQGAGSLRNTSSWFTLSSDRVECPLANEGTLRVEGGSAINGSFSNPSGSMLRVQGNGGHTYLTIADGFTNEGSIELTNVYSGQDLVANLTLSNGTLVNVGAIRILLGARQGPRILDAQLDNQGTITIEHPTTINKTSANHASSGSIDVSGGDLTFNNLTSFSNSGTLNVSGGRAFTINSGIFSNAGAVVIGANSTFTTRSNYTQTGGSTTLTSGTLAANTTVDIQGGSLEGKGIINANVINSSEMIPGTSPGSIGINGNYSQAASGKLNVEIGGLTAGSEFDQLNISGGATLDGTLNLSRINNFDPADENSFKIMTYGSRSGEFAAINGADLGTSRGFLANYNSSDLTLSVYNTNEPPVAVGDAYSVDEDNALTIAAPGVLGNDTDADGDALTAAVAAAPANGALTLNPDGSFTYTPNVDFNGADSFTYQASDGAAQSEEATVTITVAPVNDAPVAVVDAATTDEDSPVNIVLLGNDTDVDGDGLSVIDPTQGASGSVVINPDNTVIYTPNADFNGTDIFTYLISDGTVQSGVTTVTVTVNPVNDAPVAVADAVTTGEDSPVNIAVLVNDTDVDGDDLSVAGVTQPANGVLTLNPDGSFTYTPNADYNGTDSFTYQASDGTLQSGAATVTITVTPANEPPVAVDDAYSTEEEKALTVVAPGLLGNDTDADEDALTATVAAAPANGALTLNPDGSFTYTPNADYNGVDRFTYQVSDGILQSAAATVTVTVIPVNDPPALVAVGDQTVDEGQVADIVIISTDPDGTKPILSASNLPDFATFTDNENGTGTLHLAPDFTQAGFYPDVAVTATDDPGLTATATITITVNNLNLPPQLDPIGDRVVDEGALLEFTVTATNPDGDPLTFSASNLPADAMFDGTSGMFSWTPGFAQSGLYAAIRFEVSDGELTDFEEIDISVNDAQFFSDVHIPAELFKRFPTDATESIIDAALAVDAQGRAHAVVAIRSEQVVWGNERIEYKLYYTPDVEFVPDNLVAISSPGSDSKPLWDVDIAIDDNGDAHIVYMTQESGISVAVTVASNLNDPLPQRHRVFETYDDWYEVLDTSGEAVYVQDIFDPVVRIDHFQNVHVAFYAAGRALWQNSSFPRESSMVVHTSYGSNGSRISPLTAILVLPEEDPPNSRFDLQVDFEGNYHIAAGNYYITNQGGEVSTQVIPDPVFAQSVVFSDISLMLNSVGEPRIVYRLDHDGITEIYATRPDGGSFVSERLSVPGDLNILMEAPFAAIDPENYLHLVYMQGTVGGGQADILYQNEFGGAFGLPLTALPGSDPGGPHSLVGSGNGSRFAIGGAGFLHALTVEPSRIHYHRSVAQRAPERFPPEIAPVADLVVDEGKLLSFSLPAADPNGVPINMVVVMPVAPGAPVLRPLPPGIVFDAATGMLSWTPTFTQSGTYLLRFLASDNYGFASEEVTITVRDVPVADLTVTDISPADLGDRIRFTATVRNINNREAADVDVVLTIISSSGAREIIGRQTVAFIAANAVAEVAADWTSALGNWEIEAVVDPDDTLFEGDELNNILSLPFTTLPDLEAEIQVAPLSTAGDPYVLTAVITSDSRDPLTDVPVRFLRKLSSSNSWTVIGTDQMIPSIAPGASVEVSTTWPGERGRWEIAAMVDPDKAVEEDDENNNWSTTIVDHLPDLVAGELSVVETSIPGTFRISLPITNAGPDNAANTRVRFEASKEGATGATPLGEVYVSVPALGGTQTASVDWISSAGQWSLKAIIDPFAEITELDEENNVATVAFDWLPDLVAGALLVTETSQEDVLRVSLAVSNAGFMDAQNVRVRFDASGPDGAASIGQVTVPLIPQGDAQAATVDWSPTPGNWTVTARIDPFGEITEMSEENNTRVITFNQSVRFQIVAEYNGSTQADVIGRFIAGVPAINTFTVVPTLTSGDPTALQVSYRLENQPVVSVSGPPFTFPLDMGNLQPGLTNLAVTLKDPNDPDGATQTVQLKAIELPGLLGFLRNNGLLLALFHNGMYQFKSDYPSVFPGIPIDFSPVSGLSAQYSSVEAKFQDLAQQRPNLPGDPFAAASSLKRQLEEELQQTLPWVGDFSEARTQVLNRFPVAEATALKKIPIIGQLESAIAFVQDLDITYDVGSNQTEAGHYKGLLRGKVFGISGNFQADIEVLVDGDLNLTLVGTTVIDPDRQEIFNQSLFQTRQRFDLFLGPIPVTVTVKIAASIGAGLDSKIIIDQSVELSDGTYFAGDAAVTGKLSAKVSVFWGVASAKLGIYPAATFGVNAEYTTASGLQTGVFGTISIPWKATAKIVGFKKKKKGNLYEGTLFGNAPASKGLVIADDELLEPLEESENFATPYVAADGDGHAMVIWVDDVDPRDGSVDTDLFYALWDGSGFSTARSVARPNQAGEMDPVVAFDNLGNAFAVWTQNRQPLGPTPTLTEALASLEIYYARWDGQTGWWSDPQPITDDLLPDGLASLSFDAQGNGLALWVHCRDADLLTRDDWEIYYSSWDPVAQRWSPPGPVTDNQAADYGVSVAHSPDGGAITVWAQDGDGDFLDTSDSDLFYATWDDTSWSDPEPLTADSQVEDMPDLVFGADGTGHLVWHSEEEIPDPNGVDRLIVIDHLKVSQWDPLSQAWGEPQLVLESYQFLDEPQIAIQMEDGTESLVVHWRGYDDFDGDVFSAVQDLSDPGAGFGAPSQITQDEFTDWGVVSAIDAAGNVILVSMKHDFSDPDGDIQLVNDLPGGMNLLVRGADGDYVEPERNQVSVSAITAVNKVEIDKSAQIHSDVTSGGKVKIKKGKKEQPGLIDGRLQAVEEVEIGGYNHITGDVISGDEVKLPKKKDADTVVIDGSIVVGEPVDPVELPPVFFKVDPEDAPKVEVKKKETADLPPNDESNPAYGKLKVDHDATVRLHSGTYYFERFEIKHGVELIIAIEDGVPITINVKEGVYLGHHSRMTIEGGDASHVLFNVSGLGILDPEEGGKGKSHLASRIAHDAQFAGTIYSPQGKLELEQNSVAVGALIGREVKIGKEVEFTGRLANHLDLFFRPLIVAKPTAGHLAGELPDGFALLPNYPNPFNQETMIRFRLPEVSRVRLEIFDVLGQKVRTMLDDELPAGQYRLSWYGRNDAGQVVSSGVYFYRMDAGKFRAMRGMVLVK